MTPNNELVLGRPLPSDSKVTMASPYHTLPSSHKTCNSLRGPILYAIETGLQSRWVVNAG